MWMAGRAVVVEVEDGAGVEERLAVDEGLGVSEGVGELEGVKLGVGVTEGVALKGTPVTRIRKPDTPTGTAPAAKATVTVKGYTGASRLMGSKELAGLAAPGTPLPGSMPATTPNQLVTAAPLRRRVAVEPTSSVDASTCTVTGLLLVKLNTQAAPAA